MITTVRIIILAITLFPFQAQADSLSCDGGIVSTGDAVVDLLMKCGKPDWKESHREEITDRYAPNAKQRIYITVEQWTYNFGTHQLIRTVTLRNGVITDIKTGQYGHAKDRGPAKPDCCDQMISTGDSTGDVLAKCGAPYYRNAHNEELQQKFEGTQSRKIVVAIDEWTYNCGPQRFLRIITFRNGIVIDIRTGGYGR